MLIRNLKGRRSILWLSLAFAILLSWSLSCISSHELAHILINSYEENHPIPVLSDKYHNLNILEAYRVQKRYVQYRLKNDCVAGFKAGLTSQKSREKFNIDSPVMGVLFTSGKHREKATINKSVFKALMIETELGFVVGQSITHPLYDVSHLRQRIRAIIPVIELPDLGFEDMKNLKGVDIIAANVASAQFIIGDERDIKGLDPNNIVVTLTRDGKNFNIGKGNDVLGDQWYAALWLVNTVINQGWNIEPNHIIITGALGEMIPGKTGRYQADFGNLGKIHFSID